MEEITDRRFLGRHDRVIDAYGRFSLPKGWRLVLDDNREAYLACDRCEEALNLYGKSTWEDCVRRLEQADDKESRDALQWIETNACLIRADKQFRLALPVRMRKYARIGSSVALTGSFNHIQIMSPGPCQSEEKPCDPAEMEALCNQAGL